MSAIKKKTIICVVLIILVFGAFFAGKYVENRNHKLNRIKQCDTLITLALDKVENGDLADESTMKVFISDLYAAYKICDNSYAQNTLYEIWNTLLFDSNAYAGREEELARQLAGAYQVKK